MAKTIKMEILYCHQYHHDFHHAHDQLRHNHYVHHLHSHLCRTHRSPPGSCPHRREPLRPSSRHLGNQAVHIQTIHVAIEMENQAMHILTDH